MAQNARERTWRQLAAAVNNPSLRPAPLEGDLENLPKLEIESALQTILNESPEVRATQVGVARAEIALRRAQVEKLPDIMVSGGVRYSRELLDENQGGGLRPAGKEGLFDIVLAVPT